MTFGKKSVPRKSNKGFVLIETLLTFFLIICLVVFLVQVLVNYYKINSEIKIRSFLISTLQNVQELHRANGDFFNSFERVKTLFPHCISDFGEGQKIYYLYFNKDFKSEVANKSICALFLFYEQRDFNGGTVSALKVIPYHIKKGEMFCLFEMEEKSSIALSITNEE